jgi:hypothetical protein
MESPFSNYKGIIQRDVYRLASNEHVDGLSVSHSLSLTDDALLLTEVAAISPGVTPSLYPHIGRDNGGVVYGGLSFDTSMYYDHESDFSSYTNYDYETEESTLVQSLDSRLKLEISSESGVFFYEKKGWLLRDACYEARGTDRDAITSNSINIERITAQLGLFFLARTLTSYSDEGSLTAVITKGFSLTSPDEIFKIKFLDRADTDTVIGTSGVTHDLFNSLTGLALTGDGDLEYESVMIQKMPLSTAMNISVVVTATADTGEDDYVSLNTRYQDAFGHGDVGIVNYESESVPSGPTFNDQRYFRRKNYYDPSQADSAQGSIVSIYYFDPCFRLPYPIPT